MDARARMISGPQGPRVVVDGRPVLQLSSDNALGLAEHPRVREAAAEAALRFGTSGATPIHQQLEDALAAFHGTETAVLLGSPLEAVTTLARQGAAVFADALGRHEGTFAYDHADPDHLAWALSRHTGDAVVVTDAVFAADGDVAPLLELSEVAARHGARLVVDEAHALGTLGPGGRGGAAEAEIAPAAVIGSLGSSLGSTGAYVACDAATARRIAGHGVSAPAAAAALTALELLIEEPRRVEKLAANAGLLHDELAREGFDVAGSSTHILPLIAGDAGDALAMAAAALAQGVFAQALCPPAVPERTARLRLTVMASHTRSELVEAAHVLGRAALQAGLRPGTMVPVAEAQAGAEVVPLRRAA
jgi:glycine C-acetyltransferase/8-amino-7-oxononanoate synthase